MQALGLRFCWCRGPLKNNKLPAGIVQLCHDSVHERCPALCMLRCVVCTACYLKRRLRVILLSVNTSSGCAVSFLGHGCLCSCFTCHIFVHHVSLHGLKASGLDKPGLLHGLISVHMLT